MAEEKKVAKLVEEIQNLSVLELSDLVKELQDKLGVSAMPPAAQAAPGAVTEAAAETSSSGGVRTVVLADTGSNKIAVIKALREINQNLGLKEAKDLTEATPKDILTDVKAEEAENAKKKLEDAGAKVELK